MFLDGFLSYPLGAAPEFYRDVLAHPRSMVELLDLPERAQVIRALRELVPYSTARDAGEYLDHGAHALLQSAEQYFADDMVVLRHYNKAKHGTPMVRLESYTNDEHDFQVIAPERRTDAIGADRWYNIGAFRADEAFVEKLYNNIVAITGSLRIVANVAWALYRTGAFYPPPPARQ